jgi:hypothetical protein
MKGEPDFNATLSSSALKLDVALSRLSRVFESMEDFLDEVSLNCNAAWFVLYTQ